MIITVIQRYAQNSRGGRELENVFQNNLKLRSRKCGKARAQAKAESMTEAWGQTTFLCLNRSFLDLIF